MDTIN